MLMDVPKSSYPSKDIGFLEQLGLVETIATYANPYRIAKENGEIEASDLSFMGLAEW